MKIRSMYEPTQTDKSAANLIQFMDGLTREQAKAIIMVQAGGTLLNPRQRDDFIAAVRIAIERYWEYIHRDVAVGGIILNEAAAQGIRGTWQDIIARLTWYTENSWNED